MQEKSKKEEQNTPQHHQREIITILTSSLVAAVAQTATATGDQQGVTIMNVSTTYGYTKYGHVVSDFCRNRWVCGHVLYGRLPS